MPRLVAPDHGPSPDDGDPGAAPNTRPAGGVAGTGSLQDEDACETPWDESGVIARASMGEERAWAELVDRFGRRVFALAKSRVRRADLAEEITQSVFVTVSTKLRDGGYDDQGRFEPWLFRIAINRVRDEIRRQRRQADPTDPAAMPDRAVEPAEPHTPDRELELMREALAGLGDADREVVELRHHGQMSFKQMAALLDEPVGTLLARHHRALRKLRAAMEQRLAEVSGESPDGEPAREMDRERHREMDHTLPTTASATTRRDDAERAGRS